LVWQKVDTCLWEKSTVFFLVNVIYALLSSCYDAALLFSQTAGGVSTCPLNARKSILAHFAFFLDLWWLGILLLDIFQNKNELFLIDVSIVVWI